VIDHNLFLFLVGLSLALAITETVLATFIVNVIYKFSICKKISTEDISDKIEKNIRLRKKKIIKDYFGAYKVIPEAKEILFRTNFINNRFFYMSLGRLTVSGNKGSFKLNYYVYYLCSPVIYILSLFVWYAFYKFPSLRTVSFVIVSLAILMSLILILFLLNREKTSLDHLYLIIKNEFGK